MVKNNWLLACVMYFYLFYFCFLLLVRIDVTRTHPTFWIVRFTTIFTFPTFLTQMVNPSIYFYVLLLDTLFLIDFSPLIGKLSFLIILFIFLLFSLVMFPISNTFSCVIFCVIHIHKRSYKSSSFGFY